jgi:hypothetical protein
MNLTKQTPPPTEQNMGFNYMKIAICAEISENDLYDGFVYPGMDCEEPMSPNDNFDEENMTFKIAGTSYPIMTNNSGDIFLILASGFRDENNKSGYAEIPKSVLEALPGTPDVSIQIISHSYEPNEGLTNYCGM